MCSEINIIVRPSAHSICPLPDHLPIPACPYTVLYRLLPFLPNLSLGAIGIAPIREMQLELHLLIRDMRLELHQWYLPTCILRGQNVGNVTNQATTKRHAIGIAPSS
jgi:hypothetical protein